MSEKSDVSLSNVVLILLFRIIQLSRNHLTDHPQIYVCPIDGIFSRDKHTSRGKTPKAILREEMKWHMREITNTGNRFSESVVL